MRANEPLLLISLHGPAVEGGTVAIDTLAPLLRDVQLCVRRLGLSLASEPNAVKPLVSYSIACQSCTLNVISFDRGSFCVHLDVPNELRNALWPHYRGEPLAAVAVDRFLDLLNQLEGDQRTAERLPTEVVAPLKRIARIFYRGVSEITFSRFGAAVGVRDITVRGAVRWFADGAEAPISSRGPELHLPSRHEKVPPERPSTAHDLLVSLKESGLIGIWKDRTDIGDNKEFARSLRERAFKRRED